MHTRKIVLAFTDDGDPIYLVRGADDDGAADQDADGDDNNDDSDDSGDGDDDADQDYDDLLNDAKDESKKAKPAPKKYVPPSEAEYNRMRAALKKANNDQRALRQAAIDKAKKEGLTEGEAKAKADAEEVARQRYIPQLIAREARAALTEAGCKNAARLVKLIDSSSVTVNDGAQGDHEFIGLEEQINSLKAEWPELFPSEEETSPAPKKKAVPPAKKIDGADKGGDNKPAKKSSAELLVAGLTGKRGE